MLNDMVLLNVLDIMQNERDKKESPDSIEFEFDTSSSIKYQIGKYRVFGPPDPNVKQPNIWW
jgi:hypothetical protein